MDLNKDILTLIGHKIIELRKLNKQTQNDIEFLTGIDTGEISRYESGKRNLTIKTICKFALALNVHPKELLDFEFDITKYKTDG
ncbi:MAG: helix-turn-helix transcriptional regulator [Myroides sp.]